MMQPLRGLQTRVRGVFYGWWVVGAAAFVLVLVSSTSFYGLGAFFVGLEREFNWSRTLLSGAFSYMRMEGALLGPVEGFLTDRLGPRRMVLIGLAVLAVGFVILGVVYHPLTFYAAFMVVAIGAGLAGYIPMLAAVNQWFTKGRATAMALTTTGFSLGGMMVPLLAWGIASHGWRTTAFGIAALTAVAALPLSRVIRSPLPSRGQRASGSAHGAPPSAAREQGGVTVREALRSRAFWLVSLTHAAGVMSSMAIAVHGVPYLTDKGLSLGMAGTVVATYTAISLAFQLLSGFMGDRVDKRFGIAAFVAVQGLGIILLAFVGSLPMVFLFAVLFGAGLGGRTPLLNAIRADYFGRKSFGTILGLSTLPMNLGMMVAPLLLGILYDFQKTYVYGFLGLGIATAAAGALILLAPPPGIPGAAATGEQAAARPAEAPDVHRQSP